MELYRAIVKLDQENADGVQVCTAVPPQIDVVKT